MYNVRRYRRGKKGGQAGTCICVLIPLRFDPVNPEAITVKSNLRLETQLICEQIQVELHSQKDEESTESPSRKDAFRMGFPRFSREGMVRREREQCERKRRAQESCILLEMGHFLCVTPLTDVRTDRQTET